LSQINTDRLDSVENKTKKSLRADCTCVFAIFGGRNNMDRRHILNILKISVLTATGLSLFSSTAIAQQRTLKESIIGSWSVVSFFNQYADGKKVNQFGTSMNGNLTFDNNGRYSQILIGEKQPAMKSDDPRRPDALIIAYFGSYTVNEASKTITLKLERHSNSMRDGAELSWTVTTNGDALSLVGSPRKDPQGTFSPHIEVTRAK
jgi:Lipocalin-like domain